MIRNLDAWPALLLALLLVGCGGQPTLTPPTDAPVSDTTSVATSLDRVTALYRQHKQWQGTPYLLGGNSRQGIDCSAFVMRTFDSLFDQSLPRTTAAQQRLGRSVKLSQLQAGDLVFFRTGVKVRHVGIYVEEGRFLHASTSRGVMLSELTNPYWQRHYRESRRILPAP